LNHNNSTHSRQSLTKDQILELDRKHIWHPYSAANSQDPIFPVESAEACTITLKGGNKLIDGMASWWSVIHGYNHPELNRALTEQAGRFAHVMFGGLTHEPAVKLAKQLVNISPNGLNRVFFSDSGSVAVEVAMKMALQYARSTGRDGNRRHRFLALKRGYHGDTFAAMSVCDPVTGMHQLFSNVLNKHIFAESPKCAFDAQWHESHFEEFEKTFKENADSIAAVILEPIVQGTGGMIFYSPHFLKHVRRLCDEYGVLLIADEIATGLGRTGKLFACEHANISPDIMCLGKTLTAGYITLAATLCNDKVATGIDDTGNNSSEPGVLMHGPTYMANPLACAVASKSIELLLASSWQQNIKNINDTLTKELAAASDLDTVKEVRTLGGIGVIEMQKPVSLTHLQPKFVKEGIWLRPFGKLVYTIPSYSIKEHELAFLCQKTLKVLKELK